MMMMMMMMELTIFPFETILILKYVQLQVPLLRFWFVDENFARDRERGKKKLEVVLSLPPFVDKGSFLVKLR